MFNLESSIAEWRQQILAADITASALDELESHLRDEFEWQMELEIDPGIAFATAAKKIGRAQALKAEFARAGESSFRKFWRSALASTHDPKLQLTNHMNQANADFSADQRRDTYLKAAAFFLPAAFFWMVSVIFLFPLLQQLCQAAGTTSFNFDHAPLPLQAGGAVGQAMIFLTMHSYVVCAAVLLTLSLLEWRSNLWRRHRRAFIGTGAVLFNFLVLLSITLMVVTAILAAPAAAHHLK